MNLLRVVTWWQRHIPHVCDELAQSCYLVAEWTGIELMTCRSLVWCRTITLLSHVCLVLRLLLVSIVKNIASESTSNECECECECVCNVMIWSCVGVSSALVWWWRDPRRSVSDSKSVAVNTRPTSHPRMQVMLPLHRGSWNLKMGKF